MATIISPSILLADFARLGEEVNAVSGRGRRLVHFRRDGQSLRAESHDGPLVCEALAQGRRDSADRRASHGLAGGCDGRRFREGGSGPTSAFIRKPRCTSTARFNTSEIQDASPAWCSTRRRPELAGLCDRQDRHDIAHVGESRLRRAEFIPETMAKLVEARARIDASGRDIRLEIDGGVKIEKCGADRQGGRGYVRRGFCIFAARIMRRPSRHARADRDREEVRKLKGRLAAAFSSFVEVVVLVIIVGRRAFRSRGLAGRGIGGAPAFTGTISGRVLTLGRALNTTMVFSRGRSNPVPRVPSERGPPFRVSNPPSR